MELDNSTLTETPPNRKIQQSDALKNGEVFNPYKRFTGIFIPESLVRNPNISPGAKLCYGRLARYAGEDGRCFPAVKTLASEIGVSERQAQNYLKELESRRFIRREFKPGKSTNFVFLWHDAFANAGVKDIAPSVVKDVAPQECIMLHPKRVIEENHHQENQKTNLPLPPPPVESQPRGFASGEGFLKSLTVDDEKPSNLPAIAREPAATPEEVFRRRLVTRHGGIALFDIHRVLVDVKGELEKGNIPFQDFLEEDSKKTTAPSRLTNPHGHYRNIAKEMVRESSQRWRVGTLERKLDYVHGARDTAPNKPCEKCGGGGFLSKTEICTECDMGRDLARVESRRNKPSLTGVESSEAA